MNTDLTKAQHDYAIFLPAISSFYATFIGKQMSEEYVAYDRMPKGIPEMEMLNFTNASEGIFKYKWGLYSAGHANLDLTKDVPKENMIRKRKGTILLADSGGFQIAKGVWEGDWTDPNDKAAEKYRSTVLEWLCNISDYSMTLDIPTWTCNNPEAAAKVNIHSYEDAVNATKYNNEYFIKNRTGNAKFLNVLQGSNHTDADHWYQEMKKYCDPNQYENHFNGWGMGGLNMADPHLVLKRIVTLIEDGLLEQGVQDWMHFLGTSKLEWAVMLTDIQRAVRATHNPDFTISFDCASPFLATANGQVYHELRLPPQGKWSYSMDPTADDKKYANDTRPWSVGVIEDGFHEVFEDSPISEKLMMKDICIYAPGDKNKIGKEGKTSWDSFSYALLMAHNVWHHINAVQEANRVYDQGIVPKMLYVGKSASKTFRDIIAEVFAETDFNKRMAIIDHYERYFMDIVGARGMGGKKARNSMSQYVDMFDDQNKGIMSKPLTKKKEKHIVKLDSKLFGEE